MTGDLVSIGERELDLSGDPQTKGMFENGQVELERSRDLVCQRKNLQNVRIAADRFCYEGRLDSRSWLHESPGPPFIVPPKMLMGGADRY
jgi:hypothetical protein